MLFHSHEKIRAFQPLILAYFLFSGTAALIYQVLWARELELIFGGTLPAISTILSIFMAGLAFGSFYFGRLVDRWRSPLLLYAYLEMGIGIYALFTPLMFKLLSWVQVQVTPPSWAGGSGFNFISFLLSFIILITPTLLMGGTLPVLVKFLTFGYGELGKKVGKLYFVNTLGAALGALLAGFMLVAFLGLLGTILVASAINLAVGTGAFILHRWFTRHIPSVMPEAGIEERAEPLSPTGEIFFPRLSNIVILAGYGLAGFSALGLEVLLTRSLAMLVGSSVYAFSLMLTAFLTGIALGSYIISRFVDPRRNLWLYFALLEITIGLSVLALMFFLGGAPLLFAKVFAAYNDSILTLLVLEFFIIFLALLVPTILMGVAFPIASKIYARDFKRVGRRIGDIYAVNTIGSILGPLAVGFMLIPALGIQYSFLLLALMYLAVGGTVLALNRNLRALGRKAALISLLILVSLSFFLPSWNKMVMSSGVYYNFEHYSSELSFGDVKEKMMQGDLLFYKEGQLGTVSVLEQKGGNRILAINGREEASTINEFNTQRLLAHLPILLHDKAKDILVVGLGSGITLGAVLRYPWVERVDVVEIEPAVIAAASRFFSEANGYALEDPRVNLIRGDARFFTRTTARKYDIIIAEPSDVWERGSSTLFSQDMFKLYNKILKPGGIVIQWVHLYYMGENNLKTIINTFRSVFPHSTLWGEYIEKDRFLLGSRMSLKLDFKAFQERFEVERVRQDLKETGIEEPYIFLTYLNLDEKSLEKFSYGASIHTYNRPRLEFSAPFYMFNDTIERNIALLRNYMSSPLSLLNKIEPKEEEIFRFILEKRQQIIDNFLAERGYSTISR